MYVYWVNDVVRLWAHNAYTRCKGDDIGILGYDVGILWAGILGMSEIPSPR